MLAQTSVLLICSGLVIEIRRSFIVHVDKTLFIAVNRENKMVQQMPVVITVVTYCNSSSLKAGLNL